MTQELTPKLYSQTMETTSFAFIAKMDPTIPISGFTTMIMTQLTADTIYLTFPSPGNYTVKLKASNACNDTTITINLTDWTDVVELKNTRIDVYPNPATSSIKINTQEHRFETVRILDLSGRVVLNQAFKANHNIDISTLQKGMYILQLQFNNTLISTKLIKE